MCLSEPAFFTNKLFKTLGHCHNKQALNGPQEHIMIRFRE
jgi:hypothetical protein